MPNIAKNIATTEAIRRLNFVLLEKLQSELDKFTVPSGLRAPDPEAYHLSGERLSEDIIVEHGVVCLIEQVRESSVSADLTTKGTERAMETRLPVRVRIVFEGPASFEPATVNRQQQSRSEYVQLASERYCGALINTVFAYAVDNYAIQDVTLTSDYSSSAFVPDVEDEVLIGGCIVEFRLLQSVFVPAHTYEI
jgi:hypothetical protein